MNYWCGDVLYCVVVINCAFKKKVKAMENFGD